MAAPAQDSGPGLFGSLWYYRWLTLGIVLAVTALSALAGLLTRPLASAEVEIALKSPSADSVLTPGVVGDASTGRYVEQRAEFVTNDDVLGRVVADTGEGTVSELRSRLAVESSGGSNVLTVTALGPSAESAVGLANATATAYRAATADLVGDLLTGALEEIAASEAGLRGPLRDDPVATEAATQSLAALQERGAELRVAALLYGDGVEFVNAARVEDAVVPGPPLREIAVGVVLGLALAAVVTWLRSERKRRVVTATAPTTVLDAPLLGVVPRQDAGSRLARSDGSGADLSALPLPQYRLVAAALLRRRTPRVVAVLAPAGAPDRSDAALNIALAVAGDGGRVLVVDADPAQVVSGRLAPARALVAPGAPRTDGAVSWVTARDDVQVGLVSPVPAGGTTSTGAAREFAEELRATRDDYDLVVVDAPPLEATPLVTALLGIATGVLAVVPRGSAEADVAGIRRTADVFSTPVVGFVYTGSRRLG